MVSLKLPEGRCPPAGRIWKRNTLQNFPLANSAFPDQNTAMHAYYGTFWFSTTRYFFGGSGAGGSA